MARKKTRRDTMGQALQRGEGYDKARGRYTYRYTVHGQRKILHAYSLDDLREQERRLAYDKHDGIQDPGQMTLNDAFEIWRQMKVGTIRENTFRTYCWGYDAYASATIGKLRIKDIRYSDMLSFYQDLKQTRHLKLSTIDSIHTAIRQIFGLAVRDDMIRKNPATEAMAEFRAKNHEKVERVALTKLEQSRIFSYMKSNRRDWYRIFVVMVTTGLRVSEAAALQWSDVDFKNKTVRVTKGLVYSSHDKQDERGYRNYFVMHDSPKTDAGRRTIPLMPEAIEALREIRKVYLATGKRCRQEVDGYKDFVFLNRFSKPYEQSQLNSALRRIVRDYNQQEENKPEADRIIVPGFSCHTLRHSYATRCVEAGVKPKVLQSWMGHADIKTTLDIYTTATADMQDGERGRLAEAFAGCI